MLVRSSNISLQNMRRTKEIQVYLMNSRRNLSKFYDSTAEKDAKYLITKIINVFFVDGDSLTNVVFEEEWTNDTASPKTAPNSNFL